MLFRTDVVFASVVVLMVCRAIVEVGETSLLSEIVVAFIVLLLLF